MSVSFNIFRRVSYDLSLVSITEVVEAVVSVWAQTLGKIISCCNDSVLITSSCDPIECKCPIAKYSTGRFIVRRIGPVCKKVPVRST